MSLLAIGGENNPTILVGYNDIMTKCHNAPSVQYLNRYFDPLDSPFSKVDYMFLTTLLYRKGTNVTAQMLPV